MINIAIIGGGVGGISALAQLTEKNIKANFTIYEKAEIAYSSSMLSKYSSHICNTSSLANSLYNNKPDDFAEYLTLNKKVTDDNTFVPRGIFIDYVYNTFEQSVKKATRAGSHIRIINKKATSLTAEDKNSCYIFDEDGEKEQYHFVFVSTGPGLEDIAQYIQPAGKTVVANTEPDKLSAFIPDKKSIAILGSKLSAIDAALFIADESPDTKITMYSSSGELPSVRNYFFNNPEAAMELHAFPEPKNRDDLILMANYIIEKNNIPISDYSKIPEILLHEEISTCEKHNLSWEKYIKDFAEIANNVTLPDNKSYKNTEEIKRFISRYVSSFPLSNAKKILAMMKGKKLEIKKGKKDDFFLNEDKIACKTDQREYDGIILSSGLTNSFLKKDKNLYTITSSGDEHDKEITPDDISVLNKNGIWLSGSLLSNYYPLVNYIEFCVKQAFLFSESVKEQISA
ncbi:FAD/NAD(P)-binding protein [Morganella morganii]|uniref:FAD/NAD(P)-binding protein n=1 Tax=Morganella morganii TaxID=582 RepID=UPI0034E4A45A